jgi:site-specific recombinase XerD
MDNLTSDNRKLSLVDPATMATSVASEANSTIEFTSDLSDTIRTAEEFIRKSVSSNTSRAYRSDFRHFQEWCAGRRLPDLPAAPTTVALYLADLVTAGRKTSTVRRRVAAISQAHQVNGFETPTRSREVKAVLKGICRTRGTAMTAKKAIGLAELRALVATCGTGLRDRRDRALLLLGFTGAFRRSELVALDVEDVELRHDEGLVITIRRSKTDTVARGRKVGIPMGKHVETCPALALQCWLNASKIKAGPLFRAVDRHGCARTTRLSSQSVASVVKERAAAAGLAPEPFSAHSLRSGFCTSAAKAGVPEHVIARQTGHKSVAILRAYVQAGNILVENAVRSLDL